MREHFPFDVEGRDGPESLWPETRDQVLEMVADIKMGDPTDFRTFMNAVVDKAAFDKIASYIDHAKESGDTEILAGGGYDDSKGYFIEPTVLLTKDPNQRLMCEEIFGPVLTLYVYSDDKWDETLDLVHTASTSSVSRFSR